MGRVLTGMGKVGVLALALSAGLAGGQTAGGPDLRIRSAGRTALDDFRVRDGAVADDATVVLVGSTAGPEDATDRDLRPNGWVLDLTRKTPRRRFTNGHSAPLTGVSVRQGMLLQRVPPSTRCCGSPTW